MDSEVPVFSFFVVGELYFWQTSAVAVKVVSNKERHLGRVLVRALKRDSPCFYLYESELFPLTKLHSILYGVNC